MQNELATTGRIAKAESKPEAKLIDSLAKPSALEISNDLPDAAFVSLISLQKSITIAEAATAPTVVQVAAQVGEPTLIKLICAILKLFNDGLNTSLQMSARQLFEYVTVWCDEFPNETVKDLILCLKRVKVGRYGPIFNRIDGTVVSDFFRKYLDEKADWGEQENARYKGERKQENADLLASLPDEQKKLVSQLAKRPESRLPLTDPLIASDASYRTWLKENIQTLPEDTLHDVYKRAKRKQLAEILTITKAEIERRDPIKQPDQAQ